MANCAIADSCQLHKKASLPITFDGFAPTVPVTINGHPLNIAIDTGSDATLISPETAKELNLPITSDNRGEIQGTDGSRKVPTVMINLLVFGIDNFLRHDTSLISLPAPSPGPLSDVKAPTPPTGIIGTDILSHYEIEYDPTSRKLNLYRALNCDRVEPPWQGVFFRIPITLSQGQRFLVPVSLNGHKAHALFDTGLDRTAVAQAYAKQIGLTDDILARDPQILVQGAAGVSKTVPQHTFDSLTIGLESFRHPRLRIIYVPVAEADVVLGAEYMRPWRFWLSYATHVLYMQPSSTPR
jgi:predicted aspartyl protease